MTFCQKMWSIYTAIYHFTYRVYKRLKEIRHSLNLVEALAKLLIIKGFHNLWRCHLKNEKARISPGSAYYTTFNHTKNYINSFPLLFCSFALYGSVAEPDLFLPEPELLTNKCWLLSLESRSWPNNRLASQHYYLLSSNICKYVQ